MIATPMSQDVVFGLPGMERAKREIVAEHKLGRIGQPSEIASPAAFV